MLVLAAGRLLPGQALARSTLPGANPSPCANSFVVHPSPPWRGLNPATCVQVSMGVGQAGEQTSSESQALQDRRRSHPEAGPLTPSELELVTRSKLGPEKVWRVGCPHFAMVSTLLLSQSSSGWVVCRHVRCLFLGRCEDLRSRL